MKRSFPYNTVGKLLDELRSEGLNITRATFYRLEKRLGLPKGQKTSGQIKWRVYTAAEMTLIKELIKKEYNFQSDNPETRGLLQPPLFCL